ncbi:signal recognition particle, SRP9/SRP14 subunit [Conidiobolus coronatus NRRL 28638]|uniref:Signal recognition particle subunit SRP14 n=1 Tax=Conidiobolus coronatus (strain ATCC 28846 / CBS 209.66 / NRRL 28638) TaxID=796925 RepID=A0A137PIR4_CONC2|nr:signal recognition particle, SRP9/SRP14 subunit [Conidiobolus coronatus NRRL 28638]|eukprot:KXN74882.1 signal recognition particle, SRP9/SRP14 subunit [Conidiobolus coronatus NRRL 28638]
MLVENNQFLKKVESLFLSNKQKGSVNISFKQVPLKLKNSPNVMEVDSKSLFQTLVKATDNKKNKITTLVTVEAFSKFFEQLNPLLRTQMDTLKKRVRNKEKKSKSKKVQ